MFGIKRDVKPIRAEEFDELGRDDYLDIDSLGRKQATKVRKEAKQFIKKGIGNARVKTVNPYFNTRR